MSRLTIAVVVVAAVVGAAVGGLWAQERDAQARVTARAAFTDSINIGAVDAERDRILEHGGSAARDAAESEFDIEAFDFLTPPGRNFIDVDVAAVDVNEATGAAERAIAVLVESERTDQSGRLSEEIARNSAKHGEIGEEITTLESEMSGLLNREADAKQALESGPDDDAVGDLIIEARIAGEEYWRLSRERNSLLDQQNSLDRTTLQLELDLEVPSDFEIIRSSTVIQDRAATSPIVGAIGGALIALALVAFAAIALGLDRLTSSS